MDIARQPPNIHVCILPVIIAFKSWIFVNNLTLYLNNQFITDNNKIPVI